MDAEDFDWAQAAAAPAPAAAAAAAADGAAKPAAAVKAAGAAKKPAREEEEEEPEEEAADSWETAADVRSALRRARACAAAGLRAHAHVCVHTGRTGVVGG